MMGIFRSGAWAAISALVLLFGVPSSSAQTLVYPTQPGHAGQIHGSVTAIGNNNFVYPNVNNDVDGDPPTTDSSSATLVLPVNATVVHALLFGQQSAINSGRAPAPRFPITDAAHVAVFHLADGTTVDITPDATTTGGVQAGPNYVDTDILTAFVPDLCGPAAGMCTEGVWAAAVLDAQGQPAGAIRCHRSGGVVQCDLDGDTLEVYPTLSCP